MTWLQCSNNYKFIRHILNRASISDDLPIFYANSKSKFVYTSLHAEMNKKESRIAKLDQVMFENEIDDKDKTIWYNQYDIVNFNGYYNKTTGYGGSYEYYDLNGSEKTGSVSTPEKLTQLSFTDKEYAGQDVFSESGHFYTENVYGGYFESLARNPFLLNNFFAFSLVINVDARNDINLFDKINLSVPSNFDDGPNKVMSGNYLVGGITHQVSKDGIYKKMVSLHRNGMNKSQDVKQYRVTE